MVDIAFPTSVAAAVLAMIYWAFAVVARNRAAVSARAKPHPEKSVCPNTKLC